MTGGLGPLQGMGVYGSLDWAIAFKDNTTTVTLTYSVTGINPDGFAELAPIVAKVQGMQLKALQQAQGFLPLSLQRPIPTGRLCCLTRLGRC